MLVFTSNQLIQSYLFYLGRSDVGIVLLNRILSHLYEVPFALVVLGESMVVTVGAITSLTAESEQSYFFLAVEASRMVRLFRLGNLRNFEVSCFGYYFLLFFVLSRSE